MFDVDTPITEWKLLLKGFLSGSIIISSILLGLKDIPVIFLLLFVFGLLVFLDSIIPYGRRLNLGSSVIGAVMGFIIGILFYFFGYIEFYAVISVVLSLFVYIHTFFKRKCRKTWI